ncbi:hypothetical protein NKG05_17750 [Oerskovia sp. M15]
MALTLGHPHLDPFAPDAAVQVARLRERLDDLGMRVVVETGTRFLLDPFRKHHPTFLDPDEELADVRVRFLCRAVEVAAACGPSACRSSRASCPPARRRRPAGSACSPGCRASWPTPATTGSGSHSSPSPDARGDGGRRPAAARGRRVARRAGSDGRSRALRGRGTRGVRGALLAAAPHLLNVQVDDMRHTAHEHLPFGDGELDLALALGTLGEIGYTGVAAVELPRHSYDAPGLAHRSMTAMTEAWAAWSTASTPQEALR